MYFKFDYNEKLLIEHGGIFPNVAFRPLPQELPKNLSKLCSSAANLQYWNFLDSHSIQYENFISKYNISNSNSNKLHGLIESTRTKIHNLNPDQEEVFKSNVINMFVDCAFCSGYLYI